MVETTPLLPGLSPGWAARPWSRFDGERRLDLAGRLPGCVDDPRDPSRTVHSVADILRFRMMMIAAGYEDGIDAKTFRTDPVFKMALERLPGERASARSPRSAGWRTCPTGACCCGWAAPWSGSTVPPSPRSRRGSPRTRLYPRAEKPSAPVRLHATTLRAEAASSRDIREVRGA
jgi:hypothetical protein